jgi:hypothetical protein
MSSEAIIALAGSILAIGSAICAIVTFIINRKKDGYENGKDEEGLRGDIKYMRNGFDDLRLDVKEIARKQDQQNERLIRVEESCKQAHKRIDEIEHFGHTKE